MFNYFKSVKKSSKIEGKIGIKDFLNKIKTGDEHLNTIKKCRKLKELSFQKEYNNSKKEELPAYSLNFLFNKTRKDKNIIKSTGFIYLDIDNSTELDLTNEYIYSSWISLSGNGRGILIKCKSINKTNFNFNYTSISDELNINTDNNAAKATQITVLSYDRNIFINKNSKIWIAKNIPIQKHINLTPIVDNDLGTKNELVRYDNVDEFTKNLDFKKKEYLDFGKKVNLSKINTFQKIYEGKRYVSLNAIAYQYKALNPNIDKANFTDFVFTINQINCIPPLDSNEVYAIIDKVFDLDLKDLNPVKNYTRCYFFNPEYNLTGKERKGITARLNGKKRSENTRNRIRKVLNNWDNSRDGKINNKKLINKTGLSKNTITKYVNEEEFKEKIKKLNEEFKKPP